MEDTGYLVRYVYINSSQCDKNTLSGRGWEGNTFTKGNLCPTFRKIRGGQRTLSASVDSQLPLAQNNL